MNSKIQQSENNLKTNTHEILGDNYTGAHDGGKATMSVSYVRNSPQNNVVLKGADEYSQAIKDCKRAETNHEHSENIKYYFEREKIHIKPIKFRICEWERKSPVPLESEEDGSSKTSGGLDNFEDSPSTDRKNTSADKPKMHPSHQRNSFRAKNIKKQYLHSRQTLEKLSRRKRKSTATARSLQEKPKLQTLTESIFIKKSEHDIGSLDLSNLKTNQDNETALKMAIDHLLKNFNTSLIFNSFIEVAKKSPDFISKAREIEALNKELQSKTEEVEGLKSKLERETEALEESKNSLEALRANLMSRSRSLIARSRNLIPRLRKFRGLRERLRHWRNLSIALRSFRVNLMSRSRRLITRSRNFRLRLRHWRNLSIALRRFRANLTNRSRSLIARSRNLIPRLRKLISLRRNLGARIRSLRLRRSKFRSLKPILIKRLRH